MGTGQGFSQKWEKVSGERKRKVSETDWKTECARLTKAYLDYRTLLLEWKECYAPKTPEEEWDGHFGTALRELSIVEYYLDILLFGDEEDKKMLVKEKGKEVEKIERECKGAGRFADHGADGGCGCHKEIRSHLAVTNQGTVKGTMQNYMIVLREDPLLKGSLRFNLLNQRIDIVRKLWWNDGITSMTDAARDFFYLYFEQFYSLGNEKTWIKP